jgi:alpha-tubulin suppressor-like RCC1 family protein
MNQVTSVVCGAHTTAAITAPVGAEGGTGVWTWGCGAHGALGLNDAADRYAATKEWNWRGQRGKRKELVVECGGFSCVALDNECAHVLSTFVGMCSHSCVRCACSRRDKPSLVGDLVGYTISKIACGDAHMIAVSGMCGWAVGGDACVCTYLLCVYVSMLCVYLCCV